MSTISWRSVFYSTLVLGLCQSPSALADGSEPADGPTEEPAASVLLVSGGTIVTMDEDRRVIADGTVAIRSGAIIAVGASAQLDPRFRDAERIDARGKIVLPGLINAHTHVPMTLLRGVADDLALMDWLQHHIFPAEKALVDERFVRDGTRLACLEMLLGGTTTFVDMYYFEDAIAEEVEACGLRAVLGQTLIDFPAPDAPTWEAATARVTRFLERWRGHPRIIPAVAPHAPYTVSSAHLQAANAIAVAHDAPLVIHLAEDRSELETVHREHGRGPVEYLEGLGILGDHVIAAHMVWPTAGEMALLAEAGVGVAHCPQSNLKLAAGIAPVPQLRAAGVAVGLGTDGAASNNDLDLWDEIETAAILHKAAAFDPRVLPAAEVLAMATRDGARALGLEDEIGSLEVGKRADLLVVRADAPHQTPWYDPYSLLVYSTGRADVETVVVDGRVVVLDRRVLSLDAAAVIDTANTYRERVLATQVSASPRPASSAPASSAPASSAPASEQPASVQPRPADSTP